MPYPFVHLLLFELDDQRFGIATADVREIARVVSHSRLPNAPQVVEGVINFRGVAIPVLDIRARFGITSKGVELSDHLIVARAGLRTVAIRADRVIDLVSVTGNDIEDIAAITSKSEHVAGVAKLSDDIVFIHDLERFLSEAEAADLDLALSSETLES